MTQYKTVMDAIKAKQKSFNKIPIFYLDTILSSGKYQNRTFSFILQNDIGYARWLTTSKRCYITDEIFLLLK
jgi:hypothetical protein